jgi:hypothetical protein
MRISKNHLGIGFEVWDGQQTWFWLISNPHREGGTIGAALTESEAVLQARSSIEELADTTALNDWERSLGNLERYLASICVAAA